MCQKSPETWLKEGLDTENPLFLFDNTFRDRKTSNFCLDPRQGK
jgi:hypothetical protein